MRARTPDERGVLDRDGVNVAYEVHGSGDPAIVFLPAFPVADERLWKAQVPHFARRLRVLVLEPRGHGRSDRPTDPDAYRREHRVGDIEELLDATGTDRGVLVAMSQGAPIALQFAADHPERTVAVVALGAALPHELGVEAADNLRTFGVDVDGGRPFNFVWEKDYESFVEFFSRMVANQPHSSKMIEDLTEYAHETTAAILTAHQTGDLRSQLESDETLEDLAERIRCPVMLIHGTDDAIARVEYSKRAAEILGARLEILEGVGHGMQGRYPVRFNNLVDDFLAEVVSGDRIGGAEPIGRERLPTPPMRRSEGPRVLYLSSPIGLGHARRDLAIADELRALVPGARVEWLAQDPVTRFLGARDEVIHRASGELASESGHLESETDEHDLHVFEAVRQMDEILVKNFMVFLDVLRRGDFDLVIGDEAWDVDHFLHEEPHLKETRFAWLTDFVGYLPMPAKGERDAELAADYNAEMIEHVEQHPEIRDAAIFVGEPDDVIELPFGPGLPAIREWTAHHYEFSGYVTGFDPATLPERNELRTELGYGLDEVICIVAVGGSGVGRPLLTRILDAHPLAAVEVPGLRTVLVTGPRIEPDSLPDVPGVDKRAFVPDLHRHLAAADVAVVQGGLTTTMELTAAGVPFLYVPLLNHFEQQFHVRHRLERYRAGRPVDYASATPESFAEELVSAIGVKTDYRPVIGDGAANAAAKIAAIL